MATARLDMRLDNEVKANAEKAAAFLGYKSLTDYLVSLMSENSEKVIAEHESMTVENDVFDRFMQACSKARKPNKALKEAAAYTKKLRTK